MLRAQLELIREAMLLSPASEEGVEHLREREGERERERLQEDTATAHSSSTS